MRSSSTSTWSSSATMWSSSTSTWSSSASMRTTWTRMTRMSARMRTSSASSPRLSALTPLHPPRVSIPFPSSSGCLSRSCVPTAGPPHTASLTLATSTSLQTSGTTMPLTSSTIHHPRDTIVRCDREPPASCWPRRFHVRAISSATPADPPRVAAAEPDFAIRFAPSLDPPSMSVHLRARARPGLARWAAFVGKQPKAVSVHDASGPLVATWNSRPTTSPTTPGMTRRLHRSMC